MKRISIAAGLLLLSACGGPRPTEAEFFDVSRQILRFAEQDARQNQPGRTADGPLYVNVTSFRTSANKITGATISEDSMSRALGEPTHAVLEQVLLCDAESGFGGCWALFSIAGYPETNVPSGTEFVMPLWPTADTPVPTVTWPATPTCPASVTLSPIVVLPAMPTCAASSVLRPTFTP